MLKVLLIAGCLLVSGCTFKTEYGSCVGVLDDKDRDPALTYKIDKWNLGLGLVFLPSLWVPAYVVLADLWCPEGRRP